MEDNQKLKALHESLLKDNYELPSYEVFAEDLRNPEKSKAFYDGLVKDNYELPEYEVFVNDLGLKKKDIYESLGFGRNLVKELYGEDYNPESREVSKKPPDKELPVLSDEVDFNKLQKPDLSLKKTDGKFSFPNNDINDSLARAMLDVPVKEDEPESKPIDYVTALPQGFNQRMGQAIRNIGAVINAPKEALAKGVQKIAGKEGSVTEQYLRQAFSAIPGLGMFDQETADQLATSIEKAGNPGAIPNDLIGKTLGSTGSILFDVMAVRTPPTPKLGALAKYGMERVPMFPTYLASMQGATAAREGKSLGETALATAEGAASGLTYEGMGIVGGRVGQLVKELGGGQTLSTTSRALANSVLFGADSKLKGGSFLEGAAIGGVFGGYDLATEGISRSMAHRAYVSYLTATDNNIRNIAKMQVDPMKLRKQSDELWNQYEQEKDPAKKKALLEDKTEVDNIININAMTQEILKNPKAFTDAIASDERLSPEEKTLWTNKINTTIQNADPRLAEAEPIVADIKNKEGELAYWQENESVDPMIKQAKVESVATQIKEQNKTLQNTLAKPLEDYAPKKEKGKTEPSAKEKPEGETESKLAIGEKQFKTKDELNTYLEGVAIDKKTREVDERWFDREVNSWPSPETVKAINEWTENKKAEIKAKKPQPKEEPIETGTTKVAQKELTKNDLIDEIRRFNILSASGKKKAALQANTIRVNAQRLGYELKEGADEWKIGVTKDGKFLAIRKDPTKVDKTKVESQQLLSEKDQDFQDYVKEVFETNPDLYGVMIGGLTNEQRAQAFRDIQAGRKTTASAQALNELERMYKDTGGIDIWNAEGKIRVGISRDEIRAEIEDLKRRNREELNNYSYTDADKALEKGLITKTEYDEVTEYIRKAEQESRAAEEDFLANTSGDVEGGKEKGTEAIVAESQRLEEAWRAELKKNGVSDKSRELQQELTDFNKANFEVEINHEQGVDYLSKKPYEYGQIDFSKISGWADQSVFFDVGKSGQYTPNEIGKKVGIRYSSGGGSAFLEFKYTPDNVKIVSEALKDSGYKTNKIVDEQSVKQPDITTGKEGENIVQGGTEKDVTGIEGQGTKEPVKYTPEQQRQVDAINDEYTDKIADTQNLILANKKAKDKAVAEAQDRQGLFGDTKDTGEAKMFSQEQQGFGLTPERLKSIEQPYREREAELNKQLDNLRKERKSKIGEVEKQQSMSFDKEPVSEPAKVETPKTSENTLNDAVSKYGWSAVKNPEGFWLLNPKGTAVVKVKVKKDTYQFLDTGENKLMSGRGQLEKSAEKLLKDYYYAKEVKVSDSGILNKKHGGSLFKGETWQSLADKVGDYFLPKFNKPLMLKNQSDVLMDNFSKSYGEGDVMQFIEDYKKYPNATVSINAEKHSVSFPKEVADYLSKKLSKVETKAEESPIHGIKFKDKNYTDIEQVQDDLAEGKITFDESKKLMEDIRKFEDNLKTEASKKASSIGEKMNKNIAEAEGELNKSVDDQSKLFVKLVPPDVISQGNTALWKQLVKLRDGASNWIAGKLQEGMASQTDAARWVSKAITNWYGGLGRTQRDIMGKLKMTGTVKEFAPLEAGEIRDRLLKIVNSDPESLRRVRDALDPEIAKEQLVYGDLTPSEKNLYIQLRELNTWVHETNYANGFIPTDTYLKFKDVTGDSKYIARLYDQYETIPPEISEYIKKSNPSIKTKIIDDIYKMREEIDEWKKEHAITDPTYLTAKRVMQTIQNVAVKDYMIQIATDHPDLVRKVKKGEDVPKGFTKLSSSYKWGEFRNRAVADHIVEDFTGFFFANELVNKTYDAMKMFDRTGLNQFYKKFRTVYNPFVQTGNFTGNMFFSSIAGVNPATLVSKMPSAIKDMNAKTAEYKSLLKSGILGKTGLTSDMVPVMISDATPNAGTIQAETILDKARGLFEKMDKAATDLYQGSDNVAKYAAYKIFREQGLSHEQSVRRVYDAYQNYSTVGKIWDVASKTPILGNKFVKFQADLQRILLNSVTTSPLTTAGTLALISVAAKMVSALSGETEEEQKIRESRKGVAKIPLPFGMSVPLSFKFGKSEVNMARYLAPLYIYKYEDSDADLAELTKFMPFQLQKVDRPALNETGYVPAFSDPTYGFIASIIADRDFRGISIQNPKASKYHNPNPTTDERIMNVMNYVGRTQVPFYRSAQDLYDGITGNLDYYGRKRDWKQSILNNIVKIQEFDKPELKSYVERNIDYLTNRFVSLSARMGDSNAAFFKALKEAQDKNLPPDVIAKIYESQDKIRSKRLQKSLDEQVSVMQELERMTGVYKKWYPDDPFIEENFMNIQQGKNQRFNVMDDIDMQKKYKDEYALLKSNKMLKRPSVPSYLNGVQLTEEQRKDYLNTYWSEYIRQLDMMVGLTAEEFEDEKKLIIMEEPSETTPTTKKTSLLDAKASSASETAKAIAEMQLRMNQNK